MERHPQDMNLAQRIGNAITNAALYGAIASSTLVAITTWERLSGEHDEIAAEALNHTLQADGLLGIGFIAVGGVGAAISHFGNRQKEHEQSQVLQPFERLSNLEQDLANYPTDN